MPLCESRDVSQATSAGQRPFWSRASATPPPTHPAGLVQIRHSLGGTSQAQRAAATHLRFANIAHVELCDEMSPASAPVPTVSASGAWKTPPGVGSSSLERAALIPSAPRRGIVADTVKSLGITGVDTVRPRTVAGSLGPFGGARWVGTASASRSATEAVGGHLRYFSVGPIWPLMRPVGWLAQRHGSLSVSAPVPNGPRPVAGPATPGRPGSS